MVKKELPMISIILTAYKEPQTIGKAIEQILKNKLPKNYELIVTAPDKETLDVARDFQKKYKKIKIFQDAGKGKPLALTEVFKITKGKILVLTDGDIYISENSIPPLLEHFKNKKVGAVSGHPVPVESKKTIMGFWANVLIDLAHKLRKKRAQEKKFLLCSGYLFAMRNGLVKEIPSNVLDDSYISQIIWKKNYEIEYEENALVFIKNPETFKDWIKQKKRNTFGEFQIKKNKATSMRGFREESLGFFKIFPYAKNIKELFWIFLLILARFYVWLNAIYNAKIKNSSMQKVWVRIETTK